MSLTTAQISVGTTATALSTEESDDRVGSSIVVTNTGEATVFLGSDEVTTATGYALAAGATMALDLNPGEFLYGIVEADTNTVGVLRTSV